MTSEQREESYARRDEMRVQDHQTLAVIRRWLMWAGTSGLALIVGLVWWASQVDSRVMALERQQVIREARETAADARLRVLEGAERTIATTLTAQAQTQRDIRDELRELRLLIERYVRPPSAP